MPARADDPTVPADRAARLIESACPDLGPVRLAHLGRGWDHEVYLANDAWVFRFPRHAVAAAALVTEVAVLPWLAPRLPAPVPQPTRTGVGDAPARWPFAGHRLLPGVTVCDADLDASHRAALAVPLARFTCALHALSPDQAPAPLAPDPLGRFDVARRDGPSRERLATLRREGVLPQDAAARLEAVLDRGLPDAAVAAPVIVHADLHRRNLLVGPDGAFAGVIDWVDLHAGEPAVDLAAAFEVLPASARAAFFAAYGAVDGAARARARWRAVTHTLAALAGALERGDAAFARASRDALIEMSAAD